MDFSPELTNIAINIKLLILDVDGVLTDGTLKYTETGELQKDFNAKDGLGIRMLQEFGIEVAVITARKAPAVVKRMQDLKIDHFYTGHDNKIDAFHDLISQTGISPENIAYAGDDILDIPVMREVALPIAVGDAHFFAKENAKLVTTLPGGHGAVREIADALISVKEPLDNFYNRFLQNCVGKSKMDKL